MDKWLPIPWAPHYEVSSSGEVRSTAKQWANGHIVLKTGLTNSGYKRVMLKYGGRYHGHYVHRLVALLHLGESSLEVNHIDGDKLNNRTSNLEWATRLENVRAFHNTKRGTFRPHKKLDDEKVRAIRHMCANGITQRAAAKLYSVSEATISLIVNNKEWTTQTA